MRTVAIMIRGPSTCGFGISSVSFVSDVGLEADGTNLSYEPQHQNP